MSFVLVGELNPYGGDPKHALFPYPPNSAGDRLRSILDMSLGEYLRVPRFNLCTGRWRMGDAKIRAAEIRGSGDAWIVMLGRKVAAAFDAGNMRPFSYDLTWRLVALPHPSGRCREWNATGATERAREAMRLAAADPGG